MALAATSRHHLRRQRRHPPPPHLPRPTPRLTLRIKTHPSPHRRPRPTLPTDPNGPSAPSKGLVRPDPEPAPRRPGGASPTGNATGWPRRSPPTRRGHIRVLFGEHPGRARRLGATPGPLAPHQPHRPVEARRVDQSDVATSVAVRDDAARRAARHRWWRLDRDAQQVSTIVALHSDHVQTCEPDQHVAARTEGSLAMAARNSARRRLGQRRGLPAWELGRNRSWRPRRLSPGITPPPARRSPPPELGRATKPVRKPGHAPPCPIRR